MAFASSMQVNRQTGRLLSAHWIRSPNQDLRPKPDDITLIVVHGISLPPEKFGGNGIIELFTNRLNPSEDAYYQHLVGVEVSAHLLIRRGGEVIQFVDFNQRAWHAGQSMFEGRGRCNDFSIGIELEGADHFCYTAEQYSVLAEVIKAIRQAYPNVKNIVGHSDIAPGRKTDPGPLFNWTALSRLLT